MYKCKLQISPSMWLRIYTHFLLSESFVVNRVTLPLLCHCKHDTTFRQILTYTVNFCTSILHPTRFTFHSPASSWWGSMPSTGSSWSTQQGPPRPGSAKTIQGRFSIPRQCNSSLHNFNTLGKLSKHESQVLMALALFSLHGSLKSLTHRKCSMSFELTWAIVKSYNARKYLIFTNSLFLLL